jgi:hypothetical protein
MGRSTVTDWLSWREVEIRKDAPGLTAEQIGDDLGRRALDPVIVASIARRCRVAKG